VVEEVVNGNIVTADQLLSRARSMLASHTRRRRIPDVAMPIDTDHDAAACALRKLPSHQIEILKRYFNQGESIGVIARSLGIPEQEVRKQKASAKIAFLAHYNMHKKPHSLVGARSIAS
jgi:hypothetical protein